MPLQLTVDSLDSVPETLRDEYEQDGDKFRLKVEGLEDTTGLKSALEKERKSRSELEKKVRRWEALGKSEDEIAEMLSKHEAEAEKRAKESGDTEAILNQHRQKWEREKNELTERLSAADSRLQKAVVGTNLMQALSKAGVTEEGVDLLPDRLLPRIKYALDGDTESLTVLDEDGETPMIGSGKDGRATIDDLVKEAIERWPSQFKGSGQSGSGKPLSNGSGGSGQLKRSQMSNADKAKYITEHGQQAFLKLPR